MKAWAVGIFTLPKGNLEHLQKHNKLHYLTALGEKRNSKLEIYHML